MAQSFTEAFTMGVTLSFHRLGEFSRICRHRRRIAHGESYSPSARFGSRINLKNTSHVIQVNTQAKSTYHEKAFRSLYVYA